MNLFETVFSKPLFRAGLNVAALLIVSAATLSPAQSKVLARVDGVEITVEDVRLAADDMGGGIPPEMEGAEREAYVIDYLIDMRLVARKAQADKFGEDGICQAPRAAARQGLDGGSAWQGGARCGHRS
jgi:peptidyl-prolyl cis-trans isomerase C